MFERTFDTFFRRGWFAAAGHSAAVQCIGVSWALGTFFCFVFLFLGAVLWGVSHSLSDTLGWLYATPSESAST